MQPSYWSSVFQQRLSRRRALAATGATAAGAALLAACGGDDGGSGVAGDKSGLLTPFEDTSKQAKRGGTNKWYLALEPANFDPNLEGGTLKDHIYAQLVSERPGLLTPQEYRDVDPGIAASWEISPDLLTLTMKLRPNVKWHNKAPVNGRALDIDDMLFSWDRFTRVGRQRAALANSVNAEAPILSLSAPDASTIVWKLKEPVVSLLAQFAATGGGLFITMPKETDTSFDARREMIGTGAYMMSRYEPSVGVTLKRHEGYWDNTLPYMDTIEVPYVPEYATRLAQFKAGNIYNLTPVNNEIRGEDILSTKRDVPAINLYQVPMPTRFEGRCIAFGWLGDSPFRDERVRQAVSMSMDRDLWVDTFGNVSSFANEGLEVQTGWNTDLGAGSPFWVLDPKSSSFGPNAKYFEYNVAEAKKLLTAAGHPNGLDIGYSKWAENVGERETDVMDGFAQQAGFKLTRQVMDRSLEYPKYRDGNGKWEGGWAYIGGGSLAPEPVAFLTWRYSTKGGLGFLGMDAAGRGDASGDPQVEALLKRANTEVDANVRQKTIHDLQRHLAKAAYRVSLPGNFGSFSPAWPALRNYLTYQAQSRAFNNEWWIDETKAPINRA